MFPPSTAKRSYFSEGCPTHPSPPLKNAAGTLHVRRGPLIGELCLVVVVHPLGHDLVFPPVAAVVTIPPVPRADAEPVQQTMVDGHTPTPYE